VSIQDAAVIGVSLVTLGLLYVLFNRTKLGLAMRAAALYPETSTLLGVRTGLMLGLGWGLATAMGAVSGILVAPRILLEPNMMQSVIIYAFAAAVLGGIDSPVGAVVGGLALGVLLALIGAYIPSLADLRLALSLLLIVVLLVVRPSGLFGQRHARRV
jgi:branched-chain amino acid transport system permease protein